MAFQRGFHGLPSNFPPDQDEGEAPWVEAKYPGSCSECYEEFIEGVTEIQATDTGGWRGDCCR